MRRRTYLATVVSAGLAGCLGGLGTGGADCSGDCDVGMSTNAFRPETYRIDAGEAVRWVNTSSRAHTVTAYEDAVPDDAAYFATGGFDSEAAAREAWNSSLGGGLDPGGTYEHVFEVPGSYEYLCIPHERRGMVGRIVVE